MNDILKPDCTVLIGKRRYRLRTGVFWVMQARRALEAEDLRPDERARLAVWCLYLPPRPRPHHAALDAAFQLLKFESPYRFPQDGPRTLDMEQDAALIVAAFRQQYGIDLPHAALRLDWRVFHALLSGITDDTMLGNVMGIRAAKLPKRTQYNGDTIKELQKQKAIYALRNPAGGQTFEAGLVKMVEILAAMADEGGDSNGG